MPVISQVTAGKIFQSQMTNIDFLGCKLFLVREHPNFSQATAGKDLDIYKQNAPSGGGLPLGNTC